jgi:hypothetical protein
MWKKMKQTISMGHWIPRGYGFPHLSPMDPWILGRWARTKPGGLTQDERDRPAATQCHHQVARRAQRGSGRRCPAVNISRGVKKGAIKGPKKQRVLICPNLIIVRFELDPNSELSRDPRCSKHDWTNWGSIQPGCRRRQTFAAGF